MNQEPIFLNWNGYNKKTAAVDQNTLEDFTTNTLSLEKESLNNYSRLVKTKNPKFGLLCDFVDKSNFLKMGVGKLIQKMQLKKIFLSALRT